MTREQQFADKLHAYTVPRGTTNTRLKDLVDMLLLEPGELNALATAGAARLTFEHMRTHEMPPLTKTKHLMAKTANGWFK